MRYSKLLNTNIRREFDPSRYEDQIELKYFVENGKWRTACPFFAEYPWEDIPAMCLEKFARYTLSDLE
jgi:hypothetical protein